MATGGGLLSAALLLTAVVYASVRTHGWIYEDPAWQERMVADWRPIANAALWSFNLQTALAETVGALHLGNLAIHLLNGTLVYALAARVTTRVTALIAAAIFLWHPIQRTAVDYLSGRPDLLSTTLILIALWCACRRPRWYIVGLLACALAVMTKPSAIVGVPLCLLTIAVITTREAEVRAVCWLGIGLTAVLFTLLSPIVLATFLQPPLIDLFVYAGHQAVAYWRLLALVIVPVGFSIDHDYGWVTLSTGLLALGALGVAVRWGWALRHRDPVLVWAGLFTILAVAPRFLTLGAYPIGPEITEVQFYVAMVGVSIGAATLIARALPQRGVSL